MSIDNVKKLELGMNKSCYCDKFVPSDQLTDEVIQQLIDEGMRLEEEALATKDVDVLNRAFDYFFEEENDDALMNGGCESLYNEILENFTVDQIIEVLYKKFGALIANNEMRAVQFSGYCLNCDCFEQVRDIFNKTKSPNSEKFLDKFTEWYKEDYPKEISILRNDMKKW